MRESIDVNKLREYLDQELKKAHEAKRDLDPYFDRHYIEYCDGKIDALNAIKKRYC